MVYYHAGFTGRAEPILFMLEERGLQYTIKPMAELPTGEGAGYPVFACPVVEWPSGLRMAQTPALVWALGKELGFFPSTFADEAHALQCALNVADIWSEGYAARRKEGGGAAWCEGGRLDKWLATLERSLEKGGGEYFIGGALTYVDFTTLNALNVLEFCYGDAAAARVAKLPLVSAWLAAMRARPACKKVMETAPVLYSSVSAQAEAARKLAEQRFASSREGP